MRSHKTPVTTSISIVASLLCASHSSALEPGDPAPPISVVKWIQGDPVTLSEGKGKTVYVIEFFATWCAPCRASTPYYTAIQEKYGKQGVACLAITEENARVVQRYVKKNRRKIGFRVAIDDGGKTHRAYMKAAGVNGIPYAFVVDRKGRIAWHGHPLDDLEPVLDRVIAGTYKPDEPLEQTREPESETSTEELLEGLTRAYALEEWDEALEYVDKLLESEPDERRYIMAKFHLLIVGLRDVARATEWGLSLVETHRDDPNLLNELAWRMLTNEDYATRCVELAYEAAAAAHEASGGARPDIADTLARALYQIGRLDEAIRVQEKAVDLAASEEHDTKEAVLQEMKEVLDYYRACAAVRDKAKSGQ